jgi:hypothetical protein
MKSTTPENPSHWPGKIRRAIVVLAFAATALVAFRFYTGQPVFFLKWFFGLQADD